MAGGRPQAVLLRGERYELTDVIGRGGFSTVWEGARRPPGNARAAAASAAVPLAVRWGLARGRSSGRGMCGGRSACGLQRPTGVSRAAGRSRTGCVAVKVVDRTRLSAESLAQLESEAQILQLAQSHPGIVAFYGTVREGPYQCYVQEALRGDLLDRVLDCDGLAESEAQVIMIQLLQALRWLHSKGIVHGCAPLP